MGEVKCILKVRQTVWVGKQYVVKWKKVPPKGGPMSKTGSFKPSIGNGGQVSIGKGT